MANLYNSAYAVLLNNGEQQILPISKAKLIELSNGFDGATSVQDALTYLATAYTNISSQINNIGSSLSASGITYEGNTTIADKIGEVISSYEGADSALNNKVGEIITSYENADTALGTRIDDVITAYVAADTAQSTALTTALTVSIDDSTPGQYVFSQGETTIGTISIADDMVATNGTLVNERPRVAGDGEGEGNIAGTYIQMSIAHGDAFYIDVKDLVDEYTAINQTDEVTVDITNNNITATIGEISYTKITVDDNTTLDSYLDTINNSLTSVNNKTADEIYVGGSGEGNTDTILERLTDLQSQITTAAAGGITAVHLTQNAQTYLGVSQPDGSTTVTIDSYLGNVALLKYDVLNDNEGTINEDNFRPQVTPEP